MHGDGTSVHTEHVAYVHIIMYIATYVHTYIDVHNYKIVCMPLMHKTTYIRMYCMLLNSLVIIIILIIIYINDA